MTPRSYYQKLSQAGRRRYAARAGLSPEYLRISVFPLGRGQPRPGIGIRTMLALADASEGFVSREDSLSYFIGELYPVPTRGKYRSTACATEQLGA